LPRWAAGSLQDRFHRINSAKPSSSVYSHCDAAIPARDGAGPSAGESEFTKNTRRNAAPLSLAPGRWASIASTRLLFTEHRGTFTLAHQGINAACVWGSPGDSALTGQRFSSRPNPGQNRKGSLAGGCPLRGGIAGRLAGGFRDRGCATGAVGLGMRRFQLGVWRDRAW